ncbi:MAG: hypothetical protein C4K58_06060 [Flavobacteriaceae bacterium]|nr:MAG: hypothetical protein C4K58_06060 [Flavobacteriaceae bacterium]
MNYKRLAAFLGVLLFFAFVFRTFPFQLDFTQNKRYSLSAYAKEKLNEQKEPVKIIVYFQGDFPATYAQFQRQVRYLIQEMASKNHQISVEFVDPIKEKLNPEVLMKKGIYPSIINSEKDTEVTLKFNFSLMLKSKWETNKK